MNRTGFARPGALQMLIGGILIFAGCTEPMFLAALRPNHQWFVELNGVPALLLMLAGLAIVALYVVGFLRYCASKGYSKWLGFFLLLGNVFGLIVLLLLPDLNRRLPEQRATESAAAKASGTGTGISPE